MAECFTGHIARGMADNRDADHRRDVRCALNHSLAGMGNLWFSYSDVCPLASPSAHFSN